MESEEEVGVKKKKNLFRIFSLSTERMLLSLSWVCIAGGVGLVVSKHVYVLDSQLLGICVKDILVGRPGRQFDLQVWSSGDRVKI